MMKALDPFSLAPFSCEVPRPSGRELLIKIQAVGVNRADLLQRQNRYPLPPSASPILGIEISGIIEKKGPLARRVKIGERVMGLIEGGGYAEYALMEEPLAIPIPPSLSFQEAAAIPEAFSLAYQAFFLLGAKLQAKQTVLIHAGASGMGSACLYYSRFPQKTNLLFAMWR
jgi:NADPH:quinone reductase-like Zn-dependent oxidoreductase